MNKHYKKAHLKIWFTLKSKEQTVLWSKNDLNCSELVTLLYLGYLQLKNIHWEKIKVKSFQHSYRSWTMDPISNFISSDSFLQRLFISLYTILYFTLTNKIPICFSFQILGVNSSPSRFGYPSHSQSCHAIDAVFCFDEYLNNLVIIEISERL